MNLPLFKKKIWDYYEKHERDLPWRHLDDPYKVLVSETMLQQTQVARVFKKYESFLQKFPTLQDLAQAPLSAVLKEWQGLGYNRRGVNLKRTAEEVVKMHKGKFPYTREDLITFPGIGQSTAGAILAFAFQKPSVFIETNIRSVFIHYFFTHQEKVHDKEILPLILQTLPKASHPPHRGPRDWYYALMDHGVMLKTKMNPSRKSVHHIKQSAFRGSNRQKRSFILKFLLQNGPKTYEEIVNHLKLQNNEVKSILSSYLKEGIIQRKLNKYTVLD